MENGLLALRAMAMAAVNDSKNECEFAVARFVRDNAVRVFSVLQKIDYCVLIVYWNRLRMEFDRYTAHLFCSCSWPHESPLATDSDGMIASCFQHNTLKCLMKFIFTNLWRIFLSIQWNFYLFSSMTSFCWVICNIVSNARCPHSTYSLSTNAWITVQIGCVFVDFWIPNSVARFAIRSHVDFFRSHSHRKIDTHDCVVRRQ